MHLSSRHQHQGRSALIMENLPYMTYFELVRRVRDTQAFLIMAAIELRRIAERAPDIAIELRHVAQQLEADVEDLAHHDTESSPAIRAAP
jgi:hypothetical protein